MSDIKTGFNKNHSFIVWHAIVVEYLIENFKVSITIRGLLSFSGIQQVFVTQTQAVLSAALPSRSLPSYSCGNARSVAVQRNAAVLPSFTCQFSRAGYSDIFVLFLVAFHIKHYCINATRFLLTFVFYCKFKAFLLGAQFESVEFVGWCLTEDGEWLHLSRASEVYLTVNGCRENAFPTHKGFQLRCRFKG